MKKISPQIVTAAVIERDGHILIAKRRQGSRFAGKWEFPGGKLKKEKPRAMPQERTPRRA